MKIDYRKSQTPDLTKPFRNYRSHNTLVGWYKFNSKTSQAAFSNLSSGNMSAAQVEKQRAASTSEQIFGGPYVGEKDDYSISFRNTKYQNLEISDTTSQFGNNPPFTVAGWFKIPNLDSATPIVELLKRQQVGVGGSNFSWGVDYLRTSKNIRFTVSGSLPGDPNVKLSVQTTNFSLPSNGIGPDQWFHLAATVGDISGNPVPSLVNFSLRVYLNGSPVNLLDAADTDSAGGSGILALILAFFTPAAINGSIFVAKEQDSDSAANPDIYSSVDIHEIAFWRSALSSDEIYSLWSTARWWQGSGIVSDSPRNVLRARDNQSTLPTIDWPAIDRRIVFSGIPYDDQATTRVFQTSSRPLTLDYPSMIPTVDSDLRAKTVLTPNTHPQMTVNSGEGAGVYSEFQPEIKDDDPYNINPYFNIFFSPFDESQVHVDDDQLSLVYPMPINATKITRSITGSFPGYQGETSNGVFYYNLNRRRFDIIGNRDPLRYRDLYYTASNTEPGAELALYSGVGDYIEAGLWRTSWKRLGMFHSQNSDALLYSYFSDEDSTSWVTSSFKNIGQPTLRYGGPSNRRLYATSSYIFDMSKLINKPFLIESIEVRISGSIVKTFDGQSSHGFPTDAYTFFMLRQTAERRDAPNVSTISGSYREIISFKSVLGWNSKAEWSGSAGGTLGGVWGPIPKTSTTASSDWFGNYSDFAFTAQYNVDDPTQVVTKTLPFNVNINLTPKVSSAGFIEPATTLNNPPSYWAGSNANIGQTIAWTGTGVSVSYSAFGTPTGSLPAVDLTSNEVKNYFADTVACSRTEFPFAPSSVSNPLGFDLQSFPYNYFGGGPFAPARAWRSNSLSNLETKFLIYPEDNLIFGIEALPSAPETNIYAGGPFYTSSTSSYLELPSQETQLIIKGRYLKNQEYYGAPFAQQLTTDAIHTSLHYDNPVLDQFEIAQSKEYARSLRDLLITGSLTKPETGWPRFPRDASDPLRRTSLGSVISGQAGDLASLRRNYRIVDAVEKYYDSFVPDPAEMWRADGFTPIKVGAGVGSYSGLPGGPYDDGPPLDGNLILKFTSTGSKDATGGAPLYPETEIDLFFYNKPGSPQYINTSWLDRFPFEPRFAALSRKSRKDRYVINYCLNSYSTTLDTDQRKAMGYPQVGLAVENLITGHRINSNSTAGTPYGAVGPFGYQSIAYDPANSVLFGIGDSFKGFHFPISLQAVGAVQAATLEKPRGYKYGLINANPVGTSAVYRSTRYGQLRDMLEQRQYTALLIEQPENKSNIFEPKKSKSGINKLKRVNKKEAPVRFPVTVKFREPVHENPTGLTTTSPINTQCSNISLYATSSLPFFDDDVPRNRDYPSGSV